MATDPWEALCSAKGRDPSDTTRIDVPPRGGTKGSPWADPDAKHLIKKPKNDVSGFCDRFSLTNHSPWAIRNAVVGDRNCRCGGLPFNTYRIFRDVVS